MMAEQHPNILRYMRGIKAFNENDLNTAKETFSENVVYRILSFLRLIYHPLSS